MRRTFIVMWKGATLIPRFSFLAPLLILLVGLMSCQSGNSEIPFDKEILAGTLENGLEYYVVANDNPSANAELSLVINAGSTLEDDDQQGLAHFLEHMAFNGTELYPKNELVSFLQSIGMTFGADVNAYTSFDETVYTIFLPTDDAEILSKGIEILEQWAFFITLNEQAIIDEREVILGEWRSGLGAEQRILDQLVPDVFAGSPYARRLPIGKEEIIRTATAEPLRRFYEDWYRPDLMAIVAVGDFDPEVVEDLIIERFSAHEGPQSPRKREEHTLADPQADQYFLATDPEQGNIELEISIRSDQELLLTRNDYTDTLLDYLFYSMINQRLAEITQKPDQPVKAASAQLSTFIRPAQYHSIDMHIHSNSVEESLRVISKEMERIRLHGFLTNELEGVKDGLLTIVEGAWKERDTQEHSEYLNKITQYYLTKDPLPPISWEWKTAKNFVSKVKLSDFDHLIEQRLNDENTRIIVRGPEELQNNPLSKEQIFAAYRSAQGKDLDPWIANTLAEELVQETPEPGSIISEDYDKATGIYRWQLSNGALVYAKPTTFKNNEILFNVVSPGGLSLVEDDAYFEGILSSLVVEVSGVGNFTSIDLEKVLADKQVDIFSFIDNSREVLAGSSSTEDLETLLQLNYLLFTNPGLDEEAWAAYSEATADSLDQKEENPVTQYQKFVRSTLYANHPRSRQIQAEDYRRLDTSHALEIYRDRFANAGDFTFFFVGSFEPKKLKTQLERWVASLPDNGKRDIVVDRGRGYFTGNIHEEFRAGNDPKAVIHQFWHDDIPWSSDDLEDLEALNAALDILLIEKVREEIGGTYSIGSFFLWDRLPREDYLFIINFVSEPARVEELIAVVNAEIAQIATEGIGEEYVEKVIEIQRSNYQQSSMTNEWWAEQMIFIVENDLSWDYALEAEERYNELTVEDIQNSAQRFLVDTGNYAEIIHLPQQ